LRSVKDGKASNAGLFAMLLANEGHPGTGRLIPVGGRLFWLSFFNSGVYGGEEFAVTVEDLVSDWIPGDSGSLKSIFGMSGV